MHRILFVILGSFVVFLMEFLLFNLFGIWFKPDLLVLFIIFLNLSMGIRYALAAAFLGGILADSFSITIFGTHILAYMVCAFMTTVLKRYLFHTSLYSLRILLAFFITIIYVLTIFLINSVFNTVNLMDAMAFIFLPELRTTTLVAGFFFRNLKKCVLKFSVS